MAWITLNSRLSTVPLIIAGPILRRTEKGSVTVWVALKESKHVTLKIYNRSGTILKFEGDGYTTSLSTDSGGSKNIHVIAVTATAPFGNELSNNTIYSYDLEFDTSSVKLSSIGVLTHGANGINKIVYGTDSLPTFTLPASDLNNLKIVHGSCRKPHGENYDSLVAVDSMITSAFNTNGTLYARNRPQQLFLTGDQIYADDVADVMLYMIRDASNALFKWKELLPGLSNSDVRLNPGRRSALVHGDGFSLVPGEEKKSKSHLMHFSDFALMYIFAWSPELYPDEADFPTFADVGTNQLSDDFYTETKYVKFFLRTLGGVRKSFANIPVYMMFDDHEVTDDWYISRNWTQKVLNNNLGIRILTNGLLAYSIFQGWGNDPYFYRGYESGKIMLDALNTNNPAGNFDDNYEPGKTYWQKFRELVGLPTALSVETNKKLIPRTDAIPYHFEISFEKYQVIALDLRTMREFSDTTGFNFPQLLSKSHGLAQLNQLDSSKEFVIIISGTPVFGSPYLESVQLSNVSEIDRLEYDCEAWGLRKIGRERFLSKLAQSTPKVGTSNFEGHILFLSGDVHYAFGCRSEYWADKPFEEVTTPNDFGPPHFVMAQLTSSSLKNETNFGYASLKNLHETGWIWKQAVDSLPEKARIFGFTNLPGKSKMVVGEQRGDLVNNDLEATGDTAATVNVSDFDEYAGVPQTIVITKPIEWQYRIDYFMDESGLRNIDGASETPAYINIPPSGDKEAALEEYIKMAENHAGYNCKWGNGKEIVGFNNIAMVSFEWGAEESDKFVIQESWWRLTNGSTLLQPFPLTKLSIPFGIGLPDYPKPKDTI